MYDYISDYRMVFGYYTCVLDLKLEKDEDGYTDFSKITNIKKYKRPLTELTSVDIKEITDSYDDWLKNRDGTLECGFDYFKVPLLKVKSVVPYEIYNELWSTEKLSEETVKKIVEYVRKNEELERIDEHFPTLRHNSGDGKYDPLNMSLHVDSYYLDESENVEYLDNDCSPMLLELENGVTMYVAGD